MAILGFILFGLIVGVVGRLLAPGKHKLGLWVTLGIGIIGSVIGGLVANALGTGDIMELNILGSIVAFVAAAGLVGVASSATNRG